MSRILPILYNTDMVKAILDGKKKVTRRCLKYPYTVHPNGYITKPRGNENLCPYIPPYQPGDILYVRETWAFQCCIECVNQLEDESCMDGKVSTIYEDKDVESEGCYIYRAGHQQPKKIVWHPSIHMPKEAARIWLKVTDVKVEKLQDITIEGIRAEGLTSAAVHAGDMEIAMEEWKILWDSTIKKADLPLYGWYANPLVWVISFERCEKPCE